MRIFSSEEYCLRVTRGMFLTSRSDDDSRVPDFSIPAICLIGADGGHGTPEIAPLSLDGDEDPVQVPSVAQPALSTREPASVC